MTKVTELYDGFLTKISDYNFLSEERTDAEVDEELYGYLKAACRVFSRKCKQDLTIIEDEMTGEKTFVSTLTFMEEDILIALMLVEYLKPQVLSSDTIRQNMSDKDFQVYSQANHLRELGLLYRLFRTEARAMISEYTLQDIEDWFK
jgi:hypothetical protein